MLEPIKLKYVAEKIYTQPLVEDENGEKTKRKKTTRQKN